MPTVTLDLDENLNAKLCELAGRQGKSPAGMISQIIASPIGRMHFAQVQAPQDYFDEKRAVTDDEIFAARNFIEERLGKEYSGLRRESTIYGLMLAATEVGLTLCDDAGHDGFDHGYFLTQEILTDLLGRLHRLHKLGLI